MGRNVLSRVTIVLEAIKFPHSIFALPFALLGCFLAARSWPGSVKLILVILAMASVRSVAMSYNRLVDHELDKINPRTADRALPSGTLSRRSLWIFLALSAFAAALVCLLFEYLFNNTYPIVLLPFLLVYVTAYSHTKRFTWLCHYWLGSVLGLAVVAGAIAVDPTRLSWGPILVGLGVCFWTAGFDIIYSLLDIDHDCREKVQSIAARFGPARALWVSRGTHAAAFAFFAWGGHLSRLDGFYLVGLLTAGALLVLEHRLVRADDFSRVNVAFFTVNGVLSVLLSGMGVIDVLY